jgi:5-formyltetrahydrofolate cyclo-ligase
MAFVVLPLVGFDTGGERLGLGGGWYDRSFAFRQDRSAPPWLVGAAFALQQVDAPLDTADWDVALDAVCTESRTHQFRRPKSP